MLTEGYKNRIMELAGVKKGVEVIFLVGLPGSGKSTFINSLIRKNPSIEYVVASHDNILEKMGAEIGLSYNDAYRHFSFSSQIFPKFVNTIEKAVKKKKNVIIDCTNMKRSDRTEILEMFPNYYKKIAVIFNVPDEELKKRLEKREKDTGKFIPPEAIEKMKNWYIPPSKEEGFDKIISL